MIRKSNNIELKLQRSHADFQSLMNSLLKDDKKFIFQIINEEYVVIKMNPRYWTIWMNYQNTGRFVQAKITSDSLNNTNPIIEINEATISKPLFFIVLTITLIIIILIAIEGFYLMCLPVLGLAIFILGFIHLMNLHGVASFTGELIDEIKK